MRGATKPAPPPRSSGKTQVVSIGDEDYLRSVPEEAGSGS
jgi:hypothetical protein